jgi:hypothetical protein
LSTLVLKFKAMLEDVAETNVGGSGFEGRSAARIEVELE